MAPAQVQVPNDVLLQHTITAKTTYIVSGTIHELVTVTEDGVARPEELIATWVDKDGVTHTVRTPRRAGDTVVAWVTRHMDIVTFMQGVVPPVNTAHLYMRNLAPSLLRLVA
jgi:hypothetical protein